MVQTALDNEDVLAAIREWKLTAVADNTSCRPAIPGDQPGRHIHAFDAGETETFERDQTVPAPAKEFDNFGFARPFARPQSIEARNKLLNFLLRRLETQIGGFPGIRE